MAASEIHARQFLSSSRDSVAARARTLLAMSLATPTADDLDDLLLSCRYGDTEDIQAFLARFGPDPLAAARDHAGHTVLHMVAGNGHTGIVAALPAPAPAPPPSPLSLLSLPSLPPLCSPAAD